MTLTFQLLRRHQDEPEVREHVIPKLLSERSYNTLDRDYNSTWTRKAVGNCSICLTAGALYI